MLKNAFTATLFTCLASQALAHDNASHLVPADKFDMSHWKITLPMDKDKNGKVDEIVGVGILSYSHPDYFYLDENQHLVFQVHNKAITTSGSSNARSELRQMNRGNNDKIGTKDPGNNFALAAHPEAEKFGSIGGELAASLKVNHVSTHSKYPEKYPAYSVVVGQVHASKDPKQIKANTGFGYGNEPIKIFYKKWPGHDAGSVFWTYERNLEKNHPDRIDIAYPVWGNTWENSQDPKDSGILLGEEFSYKIDIDGDIMKLTFNNRRHGEVNYQINLADNVDAYGKIDPQDNPKGYAEDSFYFKAGAYGQCSVKDDEGFWSTACAGTGDFHQDKANGDYNSATFSKLSLKK